MRFGEIVFQGVKQDFRIVLRREKYEDVLKDIAGKCRACRGDGVARPEGTRDNANTASRATGSGCHSELDLFGRSWTAFCRQIVP
jgi:hypothetical protein